MLQSTDVGSDLGTNRQTDRRGRDRVRCRVRVRAATTGCFFGVFGKHQTSSPIAGAAVVRQDILAPEG